MEEQRSCEDRIDEQLASRINDFKNALEGKYEDGEYEDQIDWINSVALKYSDDTHYRAKRLLLSTFGPEDYFLFFEDGSIEYHFLDWLDGAERLLTESNFSTMKEFYNNYLDFE